MERSSPLAAMQPPSMMGSWGFRSSDMLGSHPPCNGGSNFAAGSFNFRDLSMKRSSSDYFNMKPVRGSSPTASLAADLSQNFHIDQSPQFATPRRALFTSSLFGTLNGREGNTTPPLPSSSPGPAHESMDISPLPHKIPFAAMIPGKSAPSKTDTTDRSVMDSSPSALPPLPADVSKPPPNLHERKKSSFSRPSLVRLKGYTTTTVTLASNHSLEGQLPPFKFGNRSKPSESASLSLGECFTESPPQERKSSLPNPPTMSMGPPRPRQPSFLGTAANARNGSPCGSYIRKPSVPTARPRKQFRRSLSMFEHPGDVMKEEDKKDSSPRVPMQCIMDVDDMVHQLHLPHFMPEDQPDSLPRISKETLVDILDGKFSQHYDDSWIVDCRFEYEYHGGHIEGAVNYNDKELLARKLFENESTATRTLLVFHCEYSAHRAPIMAKFVRGHDRSVNGHRYPRLNFPEIYILDGGYSSFFVDHRGRCFPQSYVEMDAKEHANTCEREMGRLRQRTKLSRAQTFAFGQHGLQGDDSPTAPGRVVSHDTMMGLDLQDTDLEQRRTHARRMASY